MINEWRIQFYYKIFFLTFRTPLELVSNALRKGLRLMTSFEGETRQLFIAIFGFASAAKLRFKPPLEITPKMAEPDKISLDLEFEVEGYDSSSDEEEEYSDDDHGEVGEIGMEDAEDEDNTRSGAHQKVIRRNEKTSHKQ